MPVVKKLIVSSSNNIYYIQIHNFMQQTMLNQWLYYTIVLGRVQAPRQTKESARRDKRPSPDYCVAICFYCVGQKHLFLLYGSKPYAGWRQPVCHLFLLCKSKPAVSIVSVKNICWAICFRRHLL